MKKILTVCILIAAVFLLATGTVFADTQSGGQTYYIANENITVYTSPDEGAYKPAFIIPKSYYFQTLQTEGNYVSICYNLNDEYSVDLYILKSDFNSKASVSKDDLTNYVPYYNIELLSAKPQDDVKDVYLYNPGTLTPEIKTIYANIERILGVYLDTKENSVYFTAIVKISDITRVLLYKAIDTNNPSFNLSSITLHQITVEKNNAENEGVISTPGDGNADVGGNNVIRNVMIAVICIMCVLVIFLIFRPTKNAKNRYEMENRENAERDRYDGYGR